ncbi:hypothetical protein Avbf_13422 [Armadillidium vulgare]|nr:hypothetical protein Avbf_13422 [Armadillidium vulgare]
MTSGVILVFHLKLTALKEKLAALMVAEQNAKNQFIMTPLCPESYEIYDGNPDRDPCLSHNDCIDDDQLCCRLYADRNDTYCREPEYVVDGMSVPDQLTSNLSTQPFQLSQSSFALSETLYI